MKRLRIEISYYLMVIGIQAGNTFVKSIVPGGEKVPHYVHKIFFTDKYGFEYCGEYVTTGQMQNEFITNQKMRFRVKEAQQLGDVIVPLLDSKQEEEKSVLPEYLKTMNGETYMFALQTAKDLKVAETAGTMKAFTPDDVESLLAIAERVDHWLVQKQAERITGEIMSI